MKTPGYWLLATAILISTQTSLAARSKCDIAANGVDATTGMQVVRTEWDALVTKMNIFGSEAYGSVAVISRGDQKFLALDLNATDYYALPPEFAELPDPSWDPAYRDFLDSLLGDAVAFPAGSTLRLDLDDQSTIVLKTTEGRRIRTNYALPGENPKARGKKEGAAKLFGKLLDNASDGDSEDGSPHYTVTMNAVLEYPLDDDAEAILSRAAVTSMRVESRDRYYRLGWRGVRDSVFSWNKKSYYKVRDALQCVNAVTGQGAS